MISFIRYDPRNLNAQINSQRSSFGVSVGSVRMNIANVKAACGYKSESVFVVDKAHSPTMKARPDKVTRPQNLENAQ